MAVIEDQPKGILPAPAAHTLRRCIRHLCGLVLDESRDYLIRDRLLWVIDKYQLDDFVQLADEIDKGLNQRLTNDVIESILTCETSFFRDPHIFEAMRSHLFPHLFKTKEVHHSPINIWCAGVSTGQEAYSIGMLATSFLEPPFGRYRSNVSVLGTDISQNSLAIAREGLYRSSEVDRGITRDLRQRFFSQEGDHLRILDDLRKMVSFEHLNMVNHFSHDRSFDLILCRNVLIYFDQEQRQKIIDRLCQHISSQGYLVLGAAENLYGLSTVLQSVRYGDLLCYKKYLDG